MNQRKKRAFTICGAACFIIACYLGYSIIGNAVGAENETAIYINATDKADDVFSKLENEAKVSHIGQLSLMSKIGGYKVKAGRYVITPGMNIVRIYRNLSRGAQTPLKLTIPSVRTKEKLAAYLGEKLMADSATVMEAIDKAAESGEYGMNNENIICLFVPNTYEVYWTISADDFIKKMKKEFDNFWNEERSAKAKSAGMNPCEVMTMASIVDEETANNGEKPMVAGMYINRLKTGMPLQADPTVKFALGQFELKRIYNNMLSVDSPYNTYRNTGLPPGPIRIPSVAGIDAVLNHVKHNYVYMCAKEDLSGTHNFAVTYAEHLQNARKYSAALEKLGIK